MLFAAAGITLAAGQPSTSPTKASTGFVLSASTASAAVDAGEQVIVHVGITNTLDRTLKVKENDGADDFEVEVYKLGALAARTEFGKSLLPGDCPISNVHQVYPPIAPGDSIWYSINVSRRFDMTLPGKYLIRISREVPNLLGNVADELERPTGKVLAPDIEIEVMHPPFAEGSTTKPSS